MAFVSAPEAVMGLSKAEPKPSALATWRGLVSSPLVPVLTYTYCWGHSCDSSRLSPALPKCSQ